MAKKEISKREENGIRARINKAVEKYGFEKFRLITNRYIEEVKSKEKLEREIEERKEELKELEAKK